MLDKSRIVSPPTKEDPELHWALAYAHCLTSRQAQFGLHPSLCIRLTSSALTITLKKPHAWHALSTQPVVASLPAPQNLDSSEISLTDVSHYFDSDPTKIVQGLRKDGKAPSAYIADTTTANAQVREPSKGSSLHLAMSTKG